MKETLKKIEKLILNQKDKIKFVLKIVFYSISYGLIVNYMLWGIFNVEFHILKFPAYGIFVYLFKEEFIKILLKFRRDK